MFDENKDRVRKKIADALGETESAEPIRAIRLDGNRAVVALGQGEMERRFGLELIDGDWTFSGELIG